MKEASDWAAHHPPMEKYLEEKIGWKELMQLIECETHGNAFTALPLSHKVAVYKGTFDW